MSQDVAERSKSSYFFHGDHLDLLDGVKLQERPHL
jgi:hypothetical protein